MLPYLHTASSQAPIVIAGAGAAGIAAALAASKRGGEVLLLESSPCIGGTVGQALIHTLGGLYDSDGELVNTGLSAEIQERLQAASPLTVKRQMGKVWVLNIDPAVYVTALQAWLKAFTNLHFLSSAQISGLAIAQGEDGEPSIQQVMISTLEGEYTQPVRAVVDATGQAAVVRQWNRQQVIEGAALAGFIIQLRGVALGALRFPYSIALRRRIHQAVTEGALPPECASVWLDTGVIPDEAYAKFNLMAADWDRSRMYQVADTLVTFLRTQPSFAEATISRYGALGIRDGGLVQGRYCLTEADIKQGRRFADTACYGCWPIEHWHPTTGVELDYFPPKHRYAIPFDALQCAGINNLWLAGKCLSAEPRVQASARVAGTCWAMGAAVGTRLAQENRR